jgi:hypothetical protein
MTKSRRMRWAGNVACVEEKTNEYRILYQNVKGNKDRKTYMQV